MNTLTRIFAFLFAGLVGLLTLSSINVDLHSSLFHGGEECSHFHGEDPCDSTKRGEEGSQEGKGEPPCPVVLFGHGTYFDGHYHISVPPEYLGPELLFSGSHPIWLSRKYDSFGARDPPVYA